MAKYRKKPVVIEAIQWTGDKEAILEWIKENNVQKRDVKYVEGGSLLIETLEGIHKASLNDFIIQGVQGEIYPCKPDIFEATYEGVDEPTIYRVFCEWDMGFNEGNQGTYTSKEDMIEALEDADWSMVEYSSWQQVEKDGLLTIEEL